jgi:VanZ family protein
VHNLFRALAVFFTVVITIGSLARFDDKALPSFDLSDKLVHVLAYGVLCISWLLARFSYRRKPIPSFTMALLVFVYGIIIEVFQHIGTSHRQADWYDLLANLVGILMATALYSLILRTKNVN